MDSGLDSGLDLGSGLDLEVTLTLTLTLVCWHHMGLTQRLGIGLVVRGASQVAGVVRVVTSKSMHGPAEQAVGSSLMAGVGAAEGNDRGESVGAPEG